MRPRRSRIWTVSRFAYAHNRDRLGDSDIRALSYFDLASDQLSLASDRASICLFLRRDIEPGDDAAFKMDRACGSFTIDTPRTVGGFAPEGTVKAGNLEATMGGYAGGGDTASVGKLRTFALNLGLAFQYEDDLLDGDSPFSKEKTESLVRQTTEAAVAALAGLPGDTSFLKALAEKLVGRTV